MLIFITILILLAVAAGITFWRVLQPGFGYAWLVASVGALLAWISTWLWQLRLPNEIAPTIWEPASLYTSSPMLRADGLVWAFALALTTLCLAAIFTAPLRALPVNPLTMAGTLTITAISLIAITASNPLTLLIAWGALDLAELAIILRTFETEQQSESAVFAFAMRSVGTGLLMWASAYSMTFGIPLDFSAAPAPVGIFLLLAAAFRLGVFPIHLPYAGTPVLRRGFGSVLRLMSAAASLILLARIPPSAIAPALAPWLFVILGMTALYSGWKWFRAEDELAGRSYWIIGMGALAVNAALGGNTIGSIALGIVLVIAGSLVFFYSHTSQITKLIMLFSLLTSVGLPFTLTATAWAFSIYWWLWPFILSAHILLIAGSARFVLMDKPALPTDQAGQNVLYPMALGALMIVALLLGVWGWEGAFKLGTWWAGLVITVLAGSLSWLRLRLKILAEGQREPQLVRSNPLIRWEQLSAGIWSLYYGGRRVSDLVAKTFEGDGGILWTLLLLVLFITLIQGAR